MQESHHVHRPLLQTTHSDSVQGRVYGRVARVCGIASSWPPEAKSPTGAEHLTQLAVRRGQGALDLKTSDLDQQGTSSVPSRAAHNGQLARDQTEALAVASITVATLMSSPSLGGTWTPVEHIFT